MNKKNNVFEKISHFITGKGFYLVVLICVAAIALSGFYLFRSVGNSLNPSEDQPVGGTADINSPAPTASPSPAIKPSPSPSPAAPSPSTAVTPKPAPSPSVSPSPAPSPVTQPSAAPSPSPAPLVFTWPVSGTIIGDYSVEVLAYDVTMGDWRTHSGIDIAAPVGTQVMSTASGTVSAVYEDDLLGTTVVVDHGNGLVSCYSNLTTVPAVKAGATVSTGTVIGAVGRTASSESRQEPHLHFSILKNDVAVNPMDYLPER